MGSGFQATLRDGTPRGGIVRNSPARRESSGERQKQAGATHNRRTAGQAIIRCARNDRNKSVPFPTHIASLPALDRALLGAAPNRWDIVLLPLVLATLFLAAWAAVKWPCRSRLARPCRSPSTPPPCLSTPCLPPCAWRRRCS